MTTLRQNPPFVSCRMVAMSPVDDEPRPQAGRRRRLPARTTRLAAALASVVLLAPLVSAAQVEWPPDRRVLRTFDEEHWPPGQQFLGSQVCQGCHPTVWKGFPGNPHFKSVAQGGRPAARTGCEGCHGPAGYHVIDPDNGKIVKFPEIEPSQAQDVCLRCHGEDIGKMHVRRSAHLTGEVGCTSCHSIHGAHEPGPLLASEQRSVCYGCHREIEARFNMPFKHRVNEGAMECTDCHNPHGAPLATWRTAHSPRMVSHGLGNDIACTKCHSDKRGPFVHEHPPVRVEGCPACHNPHGSTNARLLNRPSAFTLCLECHNDIGGFGLRAEGILPPSPWFHNLADPAFRDCVLCHSRIHGSNADSKFRR